MPSVSSRTAMRRTSALDANQGLVDRQERRLADPVAWLEVQDGERVAALAQHSVRDREAALGPGGLGHIGAVVREGGRTAEDLAVVDHDRDLRPRRTLRVDGDDQQLRLARRGRQVEPGGHPGVLRARPVYPGRGATAVARVARIAEAALEGGVFE